jgi:hypothetical protein
MFSAIGGRVDVRRRVMTAVSIVAVILVVITLLHMLPSGTLRVIPGISREEYYVMFGLALLIGAVGLFLPIGADGGKRNLGSGNVIVESMVNEANPTPVKPETDRSEGRPDGTAAPRFSHSIAEAEHEKRVVAVTEKSPKSLKAETLESASTENVGAEFSPGQYSEYQKAADGVNVEGYDASGETTGPVHVNSIPSTSEQMGDGEKGGEIDTYTPATALDGRGGDEGGNVFRTLLQRMQQIERERDQLREKLWSARGRPTRLLPVVMLAFGAITLASSVLYTETILAFIGLGLTFWGGLLIQIRPANYVRVELVGSTGLASIMTIDRFLNALGYTGHGVYLPAANLDETRVFVPADGGVAVPSTLGIKNTFVDSPKGATLIPPGLSLAKLIESELGTDVTKYDLTHLQGKLAKVITEDLEIARDFEMVAADDHVRFRFSDPIYSDMSYDLRETTRIFSLLGCPICSALACIVAASTKRKIAFEGEVLSAGGVMVAAYRFL